MSYRKSFLLLLLHFVIVSSLYYPEKTDAHVNKDDYIIILIDVYSSDTIGTITPLWNFSSNVKSYKGTGSSSSGTMTFTFKTEVTCERRSSRSVNQDDFYGKYGHVPPGVYYLDYYRTDFTNEYVRHRLVLSDSKGGVSIRPDNDLIRYGVQMHIAYNLDNEAAENISTGCITFDRFNFYELFPYAYFKKETSPFTQAHRCRYPNHNQRFSGKGNILVFVTDSINKEVNDCQNNLFNDILSGSDKGLKEEHFSNSSSVIESLRILWRCDTPATPPIINPQGPSSLTVTD